MTNEADHHDRIGPAAADYWTQSRQPLASLVFIAPLLVAYEVGILVFHVQNGADAWMRGLLDWMGFGQHFLLPILTVCILLSWHHLTRQPWRITSRVLWTMAGECLLLAFCLRLLFQLQSTLMQSIVQPMDVTWFQNVAHTFGTAIGFLGAGIYEELLFRLILLSAIAWGLKRAGVKPRLSVLTAVLLSSLVFSAAHYVGTHGDPFEWPSFMFRFLAGVFFAILFTYRGFGIAAGTHAGYDILVGVL